MANRIRYGVMNYLLFNKKRRNWVLISTLQRLHFFKLTRTFAQLPSATFMFISRSEISVLKP